MSEDLFSKLQKAIDSGNRDLIDNIKREILMSNRDIRMDANLIKNIEGKVLCKNIKKVIIGDIEDNLKCSKVISSLITHIFIECENTGNDMEKYGIKELYVILGKLIGEDADAIKDSKKFLNDHYGEFLCD